MVQRNDLCNGATISWALHFMVVSVLMNATARVDDPFSLG
jgi:hypothetical protein